MSYLAQWSKNTSFRLLVPLFALILSFVFGGKNLQAQVPDDLRQKLRAANTSKTDRREAAKKILQLNSLDSRDLCKSELRHSKIADVKEAILEELVKNWDRQFFTPVFEVYIKAETKGLKEDAKAALDSLDPAELQRHLQDLYSTQGMNGAFRVAAIDYMRDQIKTVPSEFAAAQSLFDILQNGEEEVLKDAAWKCLKKISAKTSAKDDIAAWEKYVEDLRAAASPAVRIQELEIRIQKLQEDYKAILAKYIEERQEVLKHKNDPVQYLKEYKESPHEELRLAALRFFEQKKEADKDLRDDLVKAVETRPESLSAGFLAQCVRTLAAVREERLLVLVVKDEYVKGADDLRRAAAAAIGEFGEASLPHVPKLQAMLDDSTSSKDARKAAVFGLTDIAAACQKAEDRQTLAGILSDYYGQFRKDKEQATLRFSIIHGLGNRLRAEAKVRQLMLAALDDEDKRIAFFAMEFVNEKEAVPLLVNNLASSDESIRLKAGDTLKRLAAAGVPVLEEAAVYEALQEGDGVTNPKAKPLAGLMSELLRGILDNSAAQKKEQLQAGLSTLRVMFGEVKKRGAKIGRENLKTALAPFTVEACGDFANALRLQSSAEEKFAFMKESAVLAAEIFLSCGKESDAGNLLDLVLAEKDLTGETIVACGHLLAKARLAQAALSQNQGDFEKAFAAADKVMEVLKDKIGAADWWKALLLKLDCQLAAGDFQNAAAKMNEVRAKPGPPEDQQLRAEFDRVDASLEEAGKISNLLRDLCDEEEGKRKAAEVELLALDAKMKLLPKFLREKDEKLFDALCQFMTKHYKVPNDFRLLTFHSRIEEKEKQILGLLQNPPEPNPEG